MLHCCYRKRCTIVTESAALVFTENAVFSVSVYKKYGFSKKTLELACKGADIEYIHLPDLGIVSNKRQELRNQADYDTLFREYQKTTLLENKASLLVIRGLLDKGKRLALTCFEKDPKQCHRTCVANALMLLPKVDYTLKML